MPKATKPNALKKARGFLRKAKVTFTDSTSDSETSIESAEFSHVPVEDIPDLELLAISEPTMEDLVAQMSRLTDMVTQLTNTQSQQQLTINSLTNSQAQTSQQSAPVERFENLFQIPDPIKSVPKYDGNRKQLLAWLSNAEQTLQVFKPLVTPNQYNIYVSAVLNKIEGRARDIICLAGNPQSFEQVSEILNNALGDKQELTFYKSQLWHTKMTDNMSVHKYYSRISETVQNIKNLARQKLRYKQNWDVINTFIEEDALAAFLSGLKEPYFGFAQAACPENIESAYAFVCKFKSKENTAQSAPIPRKPINFKSNNQSDLNTEKKPWQDYKRNNPETVKDTPEPMEIGSTKSKLTLNRR